MLALTESHSVRTPVNDAHICIRPIGRPTCQNTLFELLESPEEPGTPRAIEVLDYSAGDAIYRQGQVGHHLQAVCKGLVRLEQKLPDGGTRVVRLLQAGSVFGLELLASQTFMHTAISVGKSRVCRTPAPSLQRLAEHDPALHQSLNKVPCQSGARRTERLKRKTPPWAGFGVRPKRASAAISVARSA